jgi:hypothetical protein
MRSTVMFSSWPVSAFVAGLKIGGTSRALSTRPVGSGSPASVPEREYSFQAEPVMYPRITHSIGKTVVLRQSIARPRSASRWSRSTGTCSMMSSASAASM